MFFSRVENFLEKNIEGFFNRKFSSSLQMAKKACISQTPNLKSGDFKIFITGNVSMK